MARLTEVCPQFPAAEPDGNLLKFGVPASATAE
jgi:hypothetical protein